MVHSSSKSSALMPVISTIYSSAVKLTSDETDADNKLHLVVHAQVPAKFRGRFVVQVMT